jgi:hypothetical protein
VRSGTTRGAALVEASTGSLATAPDEAALTETLLGFLRSYGVLLCPDGERAPSEPVRMLLLGPPSRFRSALEKGHYVKLWQRIDGFRVEDGLVGGRFVGLKLQKVWGTIFDPVKSPARGKALALPDSASAAARFQAVLAPSEFVSGLEPPGFVRYHTGAAVWRHGRRQLDAFTGAVLPDVPQPVMDPLAASSTEAKP